VLASAATVDCNNHTTLTGSSYLGKFTLISNMTPAFAASNMPTFTDNIVTGTIANDVVLKSVSVYDAGVQSPLIPNLAGGPAVAGLCEANFWNKASVDALTPAYPKWIETVVLSGQFAGFDQVFVKNTGPLATATGVNVTVGANPAVSIGNLTPGDVWTTCVPTGSSVAVSVVGPIIHLPVGAMSFAARTVGTTSPAQSLEVKNVGTQLMKLIGQLTITGPNASDFKITAVGFSTRGVNPGASVFVKITCTPSGPGPRTATLTIPTNAVNNPAVAVPLSGSGL